MSERPCLEHWPHHRVVSNLPVSSVFRMASETSRAGIRERLLSRGARA